MADITMCRDSECPRRDDCYRFTATPCEFRQSYFVFSPREKATNNEARIDYCPMYWPRKG